MSDTLYLSLWYPNLRLASLADKLTAVLGQFARHGGEPRVYAATVWPVSWQEAPVFQRVYGRAVVTAGAGPEIAPQLGVEPRVAVEDALELLHDDYAYEFQIGWSLWELEVTEGQEAGPSTAPSASLRSASGSAQDDRRRWVRGPRLVRVTGYGPLFDEGVYEQDGHIRIDFGSDAAFLPHPSDEDLSITPSATDLPMGTPMSPGAPDLEEDAELDSVAARHMAENVRQLVDLTEAVEKASGATARLLWSELGESLAQRLAARLNQGN